MAARATQERTLGSILGLGIGDALGMPVSGLSRSGIEERFGTIDRYLGREFEDGAALEPGEFTDDTEIALCIMETYTSATGQLDPELIRARMQFLARGESRRWMSAETLRSLDDDSEPWYCSLVDDDPEVALRGVSIGLIHAGRSIDRDALVRDVETVVRLTHCSSSMVDLATLVALAVAGVLGGASERASLFRDLAEAMSANAWIRDGLLRAQQALSDGPDLSRFRAEATLGQRAFDVVLSGIAAFVLADRFEDAVFAAASEGGDADSRAGLAGALAGGHVGAGGIPQELIDGLEGRIYLTLAAPWFYRTIQLMTGRGIAIARNDP